MDCKDSLKNSFKNSGTLDTGNLVPTGFPAVHTLKGTVYPMSEAKWLKIVLIELT